MLTHGLLTDGQASGCPPPRRTVSLAVVLQRGPCSSRLDRRTRVSFFLCVNSVHLTRTSTFCRGTECLSSEERHALGQGWAPHKALALGMWSVPRVPPSGQCLGPRPVASVLCVSAEAGHQTTLTQACAFQPGGDTSCPQGSVSQVASVLQCINNIVLTSKKI